MFILFTCAVLFVKDAPQPPPPKKTDVQQIAASGRCTNVAETPDQRIAPPHAVAPGPPPILSFRLYQGKQRGRFSNSELMLDDAGH